MAERLYQEDSYLKSFHSRLRGLEEGCVALEQTAFFPTGGGVPGDQGVLRTAAGEAQVLETFEVDDEVWHRLGAGWEAAGLAAGGQVEGQLDWERRYALMRAHTATHVLCAVMFNTHGVRVTGNQIGLDRVRVDFSFAQFDRALLEQGFVEANLHLAEDLAVRIREIGAHEAEQRPELFKLEAGLRKSFDVLRLVEIEGLDLQADGGCHVASLKEIGTLELLKCENKGKGNRRVYFRLA